MDLQKISVIIPVYNCEKYLNRCVDSVLNQTYNNLEVILVDDGSPDNAGAICDEYAKKDGRVKVIHQQNSGVSIARNNGLNISSGEWISFIDSDDYIKPNMYERLQEVGYKHQADLVLSDLAMIRGENKLDLTISLEPNVLYSENQVKNEILPRFTYGGNDNIGLFAPTTKLYSTKVIKQNDIRFPEHLSWAEDTYFVVKFIAHTKSLIYIREEFYIYAPLMGGLYTRFSVDSYKQSIRIFYLFNDFIKEYEVKNINKEKFTESFVYQITWFLYRTGGNISDKKDRKKLQKEVILNTDVQKILSENLENLVSFDRRMAKAILSKNRFYAMWMINFVYSGKKDKFLKLVKKG